MRDNPESGNREPGNRRPDIREPGSGEPGGAISGGASPSSVRLWSQPSPDDIDGDYVPAYIRLARLLRAQIEAGEIRPFALLPSAPSLAATYEEGCRQAFPGELDE